MGLLKPHLNECPPIELSIPVKRGDSRQRKFYNLIVMVQSDSFKKSLQFLVDHDDYRFD